MEPVERPTLLALAALFLIDKHLRQLGHIALLGALPQVPPLDVGSRGSANGFVFHRQRGQQLDDAGSMVILGSDVEGRVALVVRCVDIREREHDEGLIYRTITGVSPDYYRGLSAGRI